MNNAPAKLPLLNAGSRKFRFHYMQGAAIVGAAGLTIRMLGNPSNKFRSAAVPALASFDLPGTSGGPVFAFRSWGTEWVGIVREGAGAPYYDVTIAPSIFVG